MTTRQHAPITVAPPRDEVRVTLADGLILAGPPGTPIEQFLLKAAELDAARCGSPLIAAIFDGRLRELSYPVQRDGRLSPVLLSSSDGGRIYRRSLVMLLTTASEELWPGVHISVRYAVPDGGFYCTLLNREPFSDDELCALESHMRAMVEADDSITKRSVPLAEAAALFAARNEDDKVRLLEQRTRNDLTLYTLRHRDDYYYGYMVPSTGYLPYFRILNVESGFILQYPRSEAPTELREITAYSKLGAIFQQSDEWLEKMGVEDIGRLNRVIREQHIHELVLVAEALHEQNIAHIAGQICAAHGRQGARIVLIAGPSSSGKTTFAKRLAIQLMANGLRPFTLELDNYFVDRELTPRDENGDYDFEALETINLALFNTQLLDLMGGKLVQLRRFDFLTGKSEPDREAQLTDNHIIIIEGIHGLNPALVPDIPAGAIFRVYVSALTQLNVDAHNRVPTTDVRLLRRIVRDARYRGYNATDTLERWQSVRRGEKRNIFPYQENADAMFNSALVYEVAVLRPLAEPLLLQVEPGTPPHIEANRLLSFLRWVHPLSPEQMATIPDTSLLREFTGNSNLRDYHPGGILRTPEGEGRRERPLNHLR